MAIRCEFPASYLYKDGAVHPSVVIKSDTTAYVTFPEIRDTKGDVVMDSFDIYVCIQKDTAYIQGSLSTVAKVTSILHVPDNQMKTTVL